MISAAARKRRMAMSPLVRGAAAAAEDSSDAAASATKLAPNAPAPIRAPVPRNERRLLVLRVPCAPGGEDRVSFITCPSAFPRDRPAAPHGTRKHSKSPVGGVDVS